MASENAKIDNNYKKTLTAITDDVAAEIRRLLVDPTTGRLKVSAVVTEGMITSLNGLTDEIQTFAVGTTGDDFNIVSAAGTHTFHIPDASATTRGLLTSTDWSTFNGKQDPLTPDTDYLTPGTAGSTYVPYTGATANLVLGDNHLLINDDFSISFGPDIMSIGTMSGVPNQLYLSGISPGVAYLDVSLQTLDNVFTFPDASGTFALSAASSTDNAIPRFDGTGGYQLQNSGITITDDNLIMFPDTAGITGWFEIGVTAQATANTDGAELDIYTGYGNGTGNGGDMYIYAGYGGATGNGGTIHLDGGEGGATDGNGGDIQINGGGGPTDDAAGGDVKISGGFGSLANGNVYLGCGASHVYIQSTLAIVNAILNADSVATSNKTFTFPNLTGTFALQEYNSSNILSTTTGINAKTVATTNLYTVPAGKTAIITEVIIRCTTATAVTVVPTLGVGIAAGEADIMPSTALTGLDTATEFYRYSVEGTAVTGAAAAVIKLGIDTGATATTMTIAVDLIGYLV